MAIKNPGTPKERHKARFIVRWHKDREPGYLVHVSKTIKYKNLRLMVTLSATIDFKIWSQDVTQAYIQVKDLTRALYVKPTKDFNLTPKHTLKLLKPLYVLTESGDAGSISTTIISRKTLKIQPTDGYFSIHYNNEGKLNKVPDVYVVDNISTGLKTFEKLIGMIPTQLESKPK